MNGRFLFVLLIGLAAGPAPVLAQSAESQAARAPFDEMMLAARLARWGLANEDPYALAMAARMRLSADGTAVERGAAGVEAGDDPAERWLAAAEALGGGDPRLNALVAEIRETGFKGRRGGPRVSLARVRAGSTNLYVEPFDQARTAVVYVEGDGDTDLDLVVRNADGAVVCREDGGGDLKMCVWTPSRSEGHTVEVHNGGLVDNAYSLATN